jgi:hypothetical protein
MSSYHAYNTAHAVADRVASTIRDMREAEREVASYCGGMAFDGGDASEIYRSALRHLGVPAADLAGMNVAGLRALLKHTPRPGSPAWRSAPMANDSKEPSVLDSILAGQKPPRDRSDRNDFRRCL